MKTGTSAARLNLQKIRIRLKHIWTVILTLLIPRSHGCQAPATRHGLVTYRITYQITPVYPDSCFTMRQSSTAGTSKRHTSSSRGRTEGPNNRTDMEAGGRRCQSHVGRKSHLFNCIHMHLLQAVETGRLAINAANRSQMGSQRRATGYQIGKTYAQGLRR
ncbi:unnamed protein product [Protopolystoma xenopodis]|uniref:Uncharacterized protein n=1 Tax=Protopolystoma xenopodis TaxID=117903 RepID=A0A448XJ75_9PLAT|nr:unnamed protein product [Protopolystoma xenopodis]